MKSCRWLRPILVGQFEFVEWTPDKHLRHSRFVELIGKTTRGERAPASAGDPGNSKVGENKPLIPFSVKRYPE
jgi:hypothetical protein